MFKSILLPVDGSPLSCKPVQAVIELARMSHAKVVVLSVAEPRLYRASDFDAIQTGKAVETMNLEAARDNVRKVRDLVKEAGVTCEAVVSIAAVPCDEILDAAKHADCDLIVMATRGKMGVLDTMFSESTTQEVLQKSPVPVLVFP